MVSPDVNHQLEVQTLPKTPLEFVTHYHRHHHSGPGAKLLHTADALFWQGPWLCTTLADLITLPFS